MGDRVRHETGSPRALPPVISDALVDYVTTSPALRSKPIPAMSISCRCSPQSAQQKIREANQCHAEFMFGFPQPGRSMIFELSAALSPYAAQFEPEERIRVGR